MQKDLSKWGVEISGTGHALPANIVTSFDLDARHGFPDGFLASKSGVISRPICDAESQIDLAVAAANAAMRDAGVGPEDVDLVVCASAIPYQLIPSTAVLVMRELGIKDGAAAGIPDGALCRRGAICRRWLRERCDR